MANSRRNFSSDLALLQIVSLICLPAIVWTLAALYRHQTESIFLPLWDYAFSFHIAFPPVVLFVLGYLIAFLTGVHLVDVPRVIVRFFRNKYLQSRGAMISGILTTVALCAGTYWYVSTTPPPRYELLVKTILRGEADDFADAKSAIKAVQKLNPGLATKYTLVLETFLERSKLNLKAAQPNTTISRLLVRALSAEDQGTWTEHPLRRHALAEAYSLLANAIRRSESEAGQASVFGDLSSETLFEKSTVLYGRVAKSNDPRAVPLMRASALNNLGNAYYYRNNFKAALAAWREANSEKLGFKNTSTWGNIIAGLVVLKQYDEAIAEGEAARNWAETSGKALQETSQFVGIIVNMAFARLAKSDLTGAVADFQFANALQGDANTKLNLALAYVLADQPREAQQVLRSVTPPVDLDGQAQAATSSSENRCAQLMWFLAEPGVDPPDRAARLYVFRGQAFSSSELGRMTADDVSALRNQIADWLPSFSGACASLAHFDIVLDVIRGR